MGHILSTPWISYLVISTVIVFYGRLRKDVLRKDVFKTTYVSRIEVIAINTR